MEKQAAQTYRVYFITKKLLCILFDGTLFWHLLVICVLWIKSVELAQRVFEGLQDIIYFYLLWTTSNSLTGRRSVRAPPPPHSGRNNIYKWKPFLFSFYDKEIVLIEVVHLSGIPLTTVGYRHHWVTDAPTSEALKQIVYHSGFSCGYNFKMQVEY